MVLAFWAPFVPPASKHDLVISPTFEFSSHGLLCGMSRHGRPQHYSCCSSSGEVVCCVALFNRTPPQMTLKSWMALAQGHHFQDGGSTVRLAFLPLFILHLRLQSPHSFNTDIGEKS
ncbi:hypothetical protein SLE2022_299410 [Rubroshorea leprosula]